MGRKSVTAKMHLLRMTRRELAKRTGYSLQYVYGTLNGKDRLPKRTEECYLQALSEWEQELRKTQKETGM